jgi:hypothetical protein
MVLGEGYTHKELGNSQALKLYLPFINDRNTPYTTARGWAIALTTSHGEGVLFAPDIIDDDEKTVFRVEVIKDEAEFLRHTASNELDYSHAVPLLPTTLVADDFVRYIWGSQINLFKPREGRGVCFYNTPPASSDC